MTNLLSIFMIRTEPFCTLSDRDVNIQEKSNTQHTFKHCEDSFTYLIKSYDILQSMTKQ